MLRFHFSLLLSALVCALLVDPCHGQAAQADKTIRVGIIGLDTSHATAFTRILNQTPAAAGLEGMKVVAAYPKGSPDIPSSVQRVPEYTETVKKMGVEIVDSIDALLEKVDAVLLETNDGRPHLEQALPVLRAGKPLFVDKPIAGSLPDAIAIFLAADKFNTPVFSSSSLRYVSGAQAARGGQLGDITGCDAFSPAPMEATHPDLYWYGIHGVETLFTVMGTGCQSVSRHSTGHTDVVVGQWDGDRIGTFRGIRPPGRREYGGTAFGTKGVKPIGGYEGYEPLIVNIAQFFRTGTPPVVSEETIEIYAFMTAADESKAKGGEVVRIDDVLQRDREQALARLNELGVK